MLVIKCPETVAIRFDYSLNLSFSFGQRAAAAGK